MRKRTLGKHQMQMLKLSAHLGSSDAYYFMTILAIVAFVLTLFIPSKEKMKQLF